LMDAIAIVYLYRFFESMKLWQGRIAEPSVVGAPGGRALPFHLDSQSFGN